MTGTTIYHVHFRSDSDHYYGSIAAIFDEFTSKEVGIAQGSLYDFKITPEHPYDGKLCTITKNEFKRKKGNRQVPLLRL
jgi:hypothetical protein